MKTKAQTNNDKLRELVRLSGLTQLDALQVFNRGLGVRGYTASTWKSFFVREDSARHRHFKDEMLEHAIKRLSPVEPSEPAAASRAKRK